ncbi:hypothetical protein ACE1B6_21065 [Aerosakkonemataceae cyanobacterium BLCC-F154]|uniref:Lipoprotein n=1 Tax=Floridaenema fluviatile BLCC-F154 TaxID=3153640 RepID=A0ABV4YFZ6_9CYAN
MKQVAKVLTIVALTACTVGISKSVVVKAADSSSPNQLENISEQRKSQPGEAQLFAQALITYQGLGEITLEEEGGNRTARISRVTIDTRDSSTAIFNIVTDDGRRYALMGRITENVETGGYKVSLTSLRSGQAQEIPAQGVLIVNRTGEISPEGELTYTGTNKVLAVSFTPTANTGETEPVRGLW